MGPCLRRGDAYGQLSPHSQSLPIIHRATRSGHRMLPRAHADLMTNKLDRLYDKAEAILEGKAIGLGEPILWHLALRHYGPATLAIANRKTWNGRRSELGRTSDAHSPIGMMYRAYRSGEPNAAQNMALTLFNVGDMVGYRAWMRRAARVGDTNAVAETRRFETRLPHRLARKLRRLRPSRVDGS